MLTINPKNQSAQDNYKLLIGTIAPRPIAFVTTENEKTGQLNGAPFSFFNIVSSDPPLISLSVQRKNGELKDTAYHIEREKEFVLHIVDEENVDKINETAINIPRNESEIILSQMNTVKSDMIHTRGVKEAKVRMECIMRECISFSNHDGHSTADLIIAEIVRFHIDPSVYDNGKIKYRELNAISRMAGNDYATIGDIMTIERPK